MGKRIINEKDVTNECQNCLFAAQLAGEDAVFCKKTGIRKMNSSCKKFKYDPLNRVPRRAPKMMEFSEKDFEL